MASSSSPPPAFSDGEYRNWAELPTELISSIFLRLGTIDIIENAQKVCKSWRRVCKDPSMWRKVDMCNLGDLGSMGYDLEVMCRHAVDRSQGGLAEISLWYFGTDKLLNNIADRSSNLRSLRLVMCYPISDEGLVEAVVKLPLLEDLEVSYSPSSGETLKVVGSSCPNLKTLKINNVCYKSPRIECDDKALAIAETMPGLRHLQLFGNRLSDTGLIAILDNCPNLEHLDLRQCFNVNLVGDLGKRCFERIKVVKRPNDSTRDYPYDATAVDRDSLEDNYHYDFGDGNGYESENSYDLPGAYDPYNYDFADYYYDP